MLTTKRQLLGQCSAGWNEAAGLGRGRLRERLRPGCRQPRPPPPLRQLGPRRRPHALQPRNGQHKGPQTRLLLPFSPASPSTVERSAVQMVNDGTITQRHFIYRNFPNVVTDQIKWVPFCTFSKPGVESFAGSSTLCITRARRASSTTRPPPSIPPRTRSVSYTTSFASTDDQPTLFPRPTLTCSCEW